MGPRITHMAKICLFVRIRAHARDMLPHITFVAREHERAIIRCHIADTPNRIRLFAFREVFDKEEFWEDVRIPRGSNSAPGNLSLRCLLSLVVNG